MEDENGAAHRAGPYSYYVVGVLMLAYVCSFVDRTILSLLVDPIKQDLQLSDVQISLLAGFAFAMFYTGMGIPFGWLADRSDRKRIIFFGVIAWSLMTAACGLARSFGGLFAARIGVGVGEASLSPASYSLIPDLFPRDQLGLAGSIYAAGITIGGGLAMMLGGAAIQGLTAYGAMSLPVLGTLAPWQLAFVLVGLLGLPVALLVLTIRDPRTATSKASRGEKAGLRDTLAYVWQRRPAYVPVLTGYSLMVVVNYALVIWVPTYFVRVHGMSAGEIGLTMGAMMLFAGTAGMFAGGLISDWMTRRGVPEAPLWVVLASVIGQAPFFIAAMLVGDVTTALALMAVAVFLITLNGGIQGATFQVLTPSKMHGQVVAIFLVVANIIGLGFGPLMIGLFTDKLFGDPALIGRSLALAAAIVLPLSAIFIALALPRARAQIDSIT
ncbi:MAG: MFS transporter [Sphingomonadales bacterium]|jgi:MFS family permease|nr:MFS transporter [Sphingomonadales bacterium]MBK9004556.1 MFS transporter [Sphingomonadales bacterium]MBK9269744.1 MFS transporter [Sphingomonadales bacterium]MBP6434351.1 MFS transporter [Sphingorhabdus sp.]